MSTEDRPWYSKDAEESVLGACLVGKLGVISQIQDIFGADENPFYLPKHAFIWAAIRSVAAEGVAPDPVTVNQRMPQFQQNWDKREGPLLLVELYSQAGLVFNPEHARIVAKYSACRIMHETALRISHISNTGDIDAAFAMVEQAKVQLGSINTTGHRQASWHDRLVDGGTFVIDIPDQIPPVWGDDQGDVLWASGEALMLVGPPGVGKSTVAGQLVAARMGLLNTVLTLTVAPGVGKLLYIAGDRPAQIARSLRRTLNREEWYDVVRERLIVWRGPPPHMFSSKPETLLAMAQDAGADTVVIDSLKDVAVGLADDVPAGQYNTARQLCLAAGVELIELHHQRKAQGNGQEPTELSDVYGNQQLTGGAGSVVLLWGTAGQSPVKLSHLKPPQNSVGPWSVAHNHTIGMSTVERAINLVQLCARSTGLDVTEATRAFFDVTDPTQKQIASVKQKLDRQVNDGRLIIGQRAGGVTIYLAATKDEEPDDRGAGDDWYR
jgi:replicative DNA helicase